MLGAPLNSLRVLACVYRQGGVRPAARALSVSPSAVSRHLRELEDWLGVAITCGRKDDGTLMLTMEGQRLADAVTSGLDVIAAGIGGIKESRHLRSVWISTVPSFAVRWLMPRLGRLSARHPNIEVSVMVDQGRGAPAPLEAEIRITMGPAGMSGIPYQAFMDDELVAVASPKLVSEKGNPERPEALTGFTLIHDRDPYTAWGRWFSAFLPNMVPPAHGPRFTSADLVLRAAEAGRGVALSRKRLVEDDLRDGRLVRVLAQYALPLPNAYLLAVPSGKNANPAILSVRNWLYEEAAREDPV